MQNRPEPIVGNYRLICSAGKGGHAEVYLAEHIHLKTQVAIKFEKFDSIEQDKFLSEAKFMATLEHPHIAKILDFGFAKNMQDEGDDISAPYLVMEYASLGTLRNLYGYGTSMPLDEILLYTKQIAEALQFVHDQNVIHLDVKPENMLVRKPNDVALSDFGIAVIGLNTSNLQQQNTDISQKKARGESLTVPGTTAYLAPERLLGHTQRACDQYSLGVVIYEWLCGKRPFTGNDQEICQKHANEMPPSLNKINPLIPEKVEQVVMKALSKQPDDRYESIWKFALALEAAIQPSPHNQSSVNTISLHNTRPLADIKTIFQPFSHSQAPDHSPIDAQPPSYAQANLPTKPLPLLNIQNPQNSEQTVPWWKRESPPFIIVNDARKTHAERQQGKDATSPNSLTIINRLRRLWQQPSFTTSALPSQISAPSTILLPDFKLSEKERKDFFISHCKTDDSWANWIAKELESAGFSVIVPNWDFRLGSNFKSQMDKAAAQAKSSILILSPDYFTTNNTQSMRNILLGQDTVNKDYVILPVLVHELSPDLKIQLEHIKYIDLAQPLDDEAEVRAKLLAEVRGERTMPKNPTTYPGLLRNNEPHTPLHPKDTQYSNVKPATDRASPIPANNIEIFFSYSRKDEGLRKELEIHLSPLKRQYSLKSWYDRHIDAGSDFAKEIDKHLKTAHIILLLVTPTFIASDYCYDIEVKKALERHRAEEAFVVPIILRAAQWKKTPLGMLQALPHEGRPVTSSTDRDAAFVEIAEGIEILINKIITGTR